MKTIYMDVTNLLNSSYMTGIQRVVSEIAVRLIAGQRIRNYRVVLLRHNRDYCFSICNEEKIMLFYSMSQGRKKDCITSRTVTVDQLSPNSFWLDVDSVWSSNIPRNLLYPQLAKRNVQIGVYVHDVISITHPQFTSMENYIRYPSYLGAVFDYADFIFTQTKSTCHEIQKVADMVGCRRKIEYRLAVPGSNFSKGSMESDKVDPVAKEIVEHGKILLTVSTLEIRKNHKVLIDAFDDALCEMGYQMVFVGKIGWKTEDLIERIKNHPEYKKSIFHLVHVNDDTLHYLYNHADFVLFPSYLEGYGLATVEAMQYGVPTILSDIPVMREVGGENCDYFAPDDPKELVEIIRRYENKPELYEARRNSLKNYHAPKWNGCVTSILDSILNSRIPQTKEHAVEQIVYLSARAENLLRTLPYVEAFMPFIKKALILCPDYMPTEVKRQYQGRLSLSFVTDSELLQGRDLPEDHARRNFFLRCLAMSRPELDDEFIMSDDDYRPLEKVDQDFFIKEGRYQAFYFYDLDLWKDIVRELTSYDLQMMQTNRFLKTNGYPNLQYASHMPQIIFKEWYQELLSEYPGLESMGCDEWSTYFNYAVKKHPESFDVLPYVTMSWPEKISSWWQMIVPKKYIFENYYDFLYDQDEPFENISSEYCEETYFENAKKRIISKNLANKTIRVRKQWRTFENKCNTRIGQFPSFVFCYGNGINPGLINPPPMLELLNASLYCFPVAIIERDSVGKWNRSKDNIRIGFRWAENSKTISAENIKEFGQALIKIGTPHNLRTSIMEIYYAFGTDEYTLACEIPVELSK